MNRGTIERESKDSSPTILRQDFSYHAKTQLDEKNRIVKFQSLPKGIEIIRDLSHVNLVNRRIRDASTKCTCVIFF